MGMASLTIRNLDDDLKRRLRIRAAENGRSMEEEVREILRSAIGQPSASHNLGRSIHAKFAAIGGVQTATADRGAMRQPPDYE